MKYYTIKEVAEMFKLSEGTVRNWVWQGKVQIIKIGNATRITEEEIHRLINNGRENNE